MILLIDNYDSFTFNLYQYLGELGRDVTVFRNDEITLEEIHNLNPEQIVLSPGPGRPNQAGIIIDLVKSFYDKIPILGVCLGFQAIGMAFGGTIIRAPDIYHGKATRINHVGTGMFQGLSQQIEVGRYHSLIIEKESLPDSFAITAWTEDNLIMGIRHRQYLMEGIQFHPESILTKCGKQMLNNFLAQNQQQQQSSTTS